MSDILWSEVYPRIAVDGEAAHLWNSSIHGPFLQELTHLGGPDGQYLEVGPGSCAFLLAILTHLQMTTGRSDGIVGIENDPRLVALAQEAGLPVQNGDGMDLSRFADKQFEVVYSQGLLEHFEDIEIRRFVLEMVRVGKKVVIGVPTDAWSKAVDPEERHLKPEMWVSILNRWVTVEDAFTYMNRQQACLVVSEKEPGVQGITSIGSRGPAGLKLKYIRMAMQENHGYGRIAGMFQRYLEQAGAKLVGRVDGDWDARVLIGTIDSWFLNEPQPDLVFHTMWEADPIPNNWFPWINNAGLLWAPSQFVKRIMLEAGVTAPICVSGYGVDPTEYYPVPRNRTGNEPFTYFVWARMHHDRKRTLTAIRAFHRANLPNARMFIKHNVKQGRECHEGDLHAMFPDKDTAIYQGIIDGEQVKNVYVVTGDLTPYQMLQLMNECDCMIYPSANEGFGLMPMEAMATGMPAIVPAYSGLADYINDETAYVLPIAKIVDDPMLRMVWGRDCRTAQVDDDALVDLIRWTYYNQDKAREKGKATAQYIAANWTWQQAGERAVQCIKQWLG